MALEKDEKEQLCKTYICRNRTERRRQDPSSVLGRNRGEKGSIINNDQQEDHREDRERKFYDPQRGLRAVRSSLHSY